MSLVLGSGHSDGPNTFQLNGDGKPNIGRKNANFHPTVWGNHFITASPDNLKRDHQTQQRINELIEEVKKMLSNVKNPLQELNLIDVIQRLGVSYHFEKEIADALLHIYNAYKEGKYESDDLNTVALRFRLLRQEGFRVSPDVFLKFKDEEGNFLNTLASDIRGLLSLYEASHLVIHGEDILDEANAFSRKHLKLALPQLNSSPLSRQVDLALELPMRRSVERLLSRYYISIYQEENERNDALLEFAKLDFNLLQSLHQEEIREISMWWNRWDFGSKLPFIRDRVVECYFWILGVYSEPQYSRARRIMTKCLALTSILDDIYDVYGTLEELELYTSAIQRWDKSIADQLPDYMKLHFHALLDAVDKFEEELALEEKSYRIPYLKEAFKEIAKYYLIEVQWFNSGYVPATYEEHMSVALISCGYALLTVVSFVGMGDIATKEAFEWANRRSMPKLINAVSVVNRLRDDITSNKKEQERGHVVSSIEVYMKEHGLAYEEVCNKFREMVADAWKDINEQCLKPIVFPMALLIRPVNLARVMEVLYKHRDEYTESTNETKERISLVLVHRVTI